MTEYTAYCPVGNIRAGVSDKSWKTKPYTSLKATSNRIPENPDLVTKGICNKPIDCEHAESCSLLVMLSQLGTRHAIINFIATGQGE